MEQEFKYPPNSNRSKELAAKQEKKVDKVVSGKTATKKKNGFAKAAESILPGDAKSIGSYILMDVLVPAIKKAISDIVCNGINMLLGESPTKRSGGSVPAARVSYRQYYQDPERRDYARPRAQVGYSYDDVVFETRADAELVRNSMVEMLDHFQVVSVADMLEMSGLKSNYTDNKYGWMDIRAIESAEIMRSGDGYILKLPRATTL